MPGGLSGGQELSRARARLIFLASAEHRFDRVRPEIEAQATVRRSSRPDDYRAGSLLFVPDEARLLHLVRWRKAPTAALRSTRPWGAVEAHNPELRDVLPTGYPAAGEIDAH
jgi:type I restriction enzyme M protein